MTDDTPPPAQVKPRSRAEAFSELLKDKRLGHGAFRLWHYLYAHLNYTRRDSIVFPGFRSMIKDLGCHKDSIPAWLNELEASGWARTIRRYSKDDHRKGGKRPANHYEVQNGLGEALLESIRDSAPKNRPAPAPKNRPANGRTGNQPRSEDKNSHDPHRKSGAELTPHKGRVGKKERVCGVEGEMDATDLNRSLDGSAVAGAQQPSASLHTWEEES